MNATGLGAFLDGSTVFNHDTPRIIPGFAILTNGRSLDRDLSDQTHTLLVRLTEDLLLIEIKKFNSHRNSAKRIGKELRSQICGHTNGVVSRTF